MLLIKAFHIIAIVAWFAGLFYLPRLFVYHSQTQGRETLELLMIMERRLFMYIMWPAAILTTLLGFWLLSFQWAYYMHQPWMHIKLTLVLVLWAYHFLCGHNLRQLKTQPKYHTTRYYRFFNEIPTLLLIGIVLMVVVRPG